MAAPDRILGKGARLYYSTDGGSTYTELTEISELGAKTLGPRSRIVSMPEATPGQKRIDVTEWVVNHNKTKESFDWLFAKARGGLS